MKEKIDHEVIWASIWPLFFKAPDTPETPLQESPSYQAYYEELTYYRGLKNSPFSDEFRAIFLPFKHLIGPRLPWNEIYNCLRDFPFEPERKYFLIMKLTAGDIENAMKVMKQFQEGKKQVNHALKQLPSIVQNLDKLHVCTPDEMAKLKLKIPMLQNMRDVFSDIEKFIRETFHLDKNLHTAVQKQKYWNTIVSQSLREINFFCHTDLCNDDKSKGIVCKITHDKAYKTIAKLLKIIYPTIWTEDVKTIANRIKQKDYRNISY